MHPPTPSIAVTVAHWGDLGPCTEKMGWFENSKTTWLYSSRHGPCRLLLLLKWPSTRHQRRPSLPDCQINRFYLHSLLWMSLQNTIAIFYSDNKGCLCQPSRRRRGRAFSWLGTALTWSQVHGSNRSKLRYHARACPEAVCLTVVGRAQLSHPLRQFVCSGDSERRWTP